MSCGLEVYKRQRTQHRVGAERCNGFTQWSIHIEGHTRFAVGGD